MSNSIQKPNRFAGYYMKRRKWPLKGYHRRFIVLDDGWLKYGKNEEMRRAHGALDLGDAAIVKDKKDEIHIGLLFHMAHMIWVFRFRSIIEPKRSKAN